MSVLEFRKAFFRKQKQKEKMIFLRGADSEFIVGEKPWGSQPPTHNAMAKAVKQVQWNHLDYQKSDYLYCLDLDLLTKHCTMKVDLITNLD